MEKTEQKVYPKLSGKKRKAFEMKFDGKTYAEIALATGYSVRTLEVSLNPKGRWYDHYDWWSDQQIAIIEKQTRKRMSQRVNEALTVLELAISQAQKDMRAAIKAANSILDRSGFKAPEKIEFTDPDDHAEKITKFFEGRNKQQNDE